MERFVFLRGNNYNDDHNAVVVDDLDNDFFFKILWHILII